MQNDIHPNDPINDITGKIIDAAIKVHKLYGPGLLESAYEQILIYELITNKNLDVEAQKHLPIIHEGQKIESAFRIDLLVENKVIVELKAQDKILPIHQAQLMTYLKLSQKRLGLLINFNVSLLKDGIKRIVL
jgi:GxxExxY protein